jgi:hypothetical protein
LLSDRARVELLRIALEGAQIAAELAGLGGEEAEAFWDAEVHLRAVCRVLIAKRGQGFFGIDADRRYALRSVIAWTARQVAPALRRELRAYAWRIGVYS